MSELLQLFKKSGEKLVLAESCTGGALAAEISSEPGISEFFCGSFVVYQESSKQNWLGVPARLLEQKGAVSRECAIAMAELALEKTPQATIAISVTGYLGPGNPRDGTVFIGVARRIKKSASALELSVFPTPARSLDPKKLRQKRRDVTSSLILLLVRWLLSPTHSPKGR